ncbi:organic solute transporter Ostalpha-domain-containing protein [Dendryphion nanum]|uniref:Organic solute transporter Ostalpha-domain-containing protein n=1 Tax=Dendryphion nanum TaxID=256645 RepID=A0A9P9EDR8_9PLEO|nr:organic solute transporter Ostalpha-domain-containing protein [Dendryphion nanum]
MSSISSNTLATYTLFRREDAYFECSRPRPNEHGEPLAIGITFKLLMTYITIACLGLTAISTFILQWKHLHRYTRPKEQRQVVRIVFMPFFFCVIALLCLLFYEQSIYLKPIMHTYEAFCVAALFFLFLEIVCPDEENRARFFSSVDNKDKKGNIIPGGSQLWFNRTYAVVLQFPLTKILSCIVEITTQAAGVYCNNSLSPKHAHFWVQVFDIFIIGGAVSAIIRFWGRLKADFDPGHHALAKLVSFKSIILLQFLQDILFGWLNGKTFKPSAKYTYDDLYYGISMMLTAIEALLFSLFFHWSFRSRIYHEDERAGAKRMPVFRAALDALNISDIFFGIITAFKLLLVKSSPKGHGFKFGAQFGAPKEYDGIVDVPSISEPSRQEEGRKERQVRRERPIRGE